MSRLPPPSPRRRRRRRPLGQLHRRRHRLRRHRSDAARRRYLPRRRRPSPTVSWSPPTSAATGSRSGRCWRSPCSRSGRSCTPAPSRLRPRKPPARWRSEPTPTRSARAATAGPARAASGTRSRAVRCSRPSPTSRISCASCTTAPSSTRRPGSTSTATPNREGGPHVVFGRNGAAMPAWGGNLTDAEILGVVCHERYDLGGAESHRLGDRVRAMVCRRLRDLRRPRGRRRHPHARATLPRHHRDR